MESPYLSSTSSTKPPSRAKKAPDIEHCRWTESRILVGEASNDRLQEKLQATASLNRSQAQVLEEDTDALERDAKAVYAIRSLDIDNPTSSPPRLRQTTSWLTDWSQPRCDADLDLY